MVLRLLFNCFISCLCITALQAEPANLNLLQKEVVAYHDSGAYEKELTAVITKAHRYMHKQVKSHAGKDKLALVLDIDETSLSNYQSMAKQHFWPDKKQIHAHILAAKAPAIKPMLTLYNDAIKNHVAVFFVTGRPLDEMSATKTNLLRAGYKNWSGLYLRPVDYQKPSIIPFKSGMRKQIAAQGYTIIASIGDQESDLAGGYALKGFKLPNPYYYLP